MDLLNVHGCRPQDLVEALGCRPDEARRLLAAEVAGAPARPVRRSLTVGIDRSRPEVLERVPDPVDHSVRYLLRHADGALSEAVRIPLAKPGRFSICLSSQVGCAMRCAFCATGTLGLDRHLEAHEMVGAWCTVRDEAPGPVTGAVFMGQGEPFHNYEAVIRAAQVLSDPNGGRIAQKAITISTVGLVPQIRRFTEEGHKFRLIVSLTSALPELRGELLPIAGRWSLAELADALGDYHRATRRRITLAWVLLGGVNDQPEQVAALAEHFGDLPIRVNLIDVNGDLGFRRATDAERDHFMDALQALRVPIVRRYSVGASQDSACGMLAARHAPQATV